MDRISNYLKGIAETQANAQGKPRFGVVTSYKPGLAKVQLQPENVLTGWLPVCSTSVGNGWGIHIPLRPGDQVCVLPQDGHAGHGVIVGRVYSDTNQPPDATSDDIVMRSSAGALVILSSSGHITISDPSGTSVTLTNDNKLTLNANTVTINCQDFQVNASVGANIESPFTTVSNELDVGTGPIKQNGVVVVVP